MTNKRDIPVQANDEDLQELKPDIHQSLGSKKMQETFENDIALLQKRITKITDQVIDLNTKVNQRNNHLIHSASKIIHEVLHET